MTGGNDRAGIQGRDSVQKLLQLLSGLRHAPAGRLIYAQVEAMLEEMAGNHLRTEMAYAGMVHILLDALLGQMEPGSADHLRIRLLQGRLQPPLTAAESDVLSGFVGEVAADMLAGDRPEPDMMLRAVQPLLAAFGLDTATMAATGTGAGPDIEGQGQDYQAWAALAAGPAEAGEPAVEDEAVPEQQEAAEAAVMMPVEEVTGELVEDDDFISKEIPAGQDLNDINRSELESRREDIAKLQAMLGDQVLETISKNEEFGAVLEVVMNDLRQADSNDELENVRWRLIRQVEKMRGGQNDLADKLDSTHHYLQMYESDSRELTDELTRVRLLSLTDELTGLPNRRAFMRRLEDEVARVQRYGFPLSFVLIDLDHFKSVNDDYGHAAGDEVLRVYSRNILSIFRHHDMVARYGGEEFAVLLPNTDSDGTIRALNKVRRRAAETRWQTNGKMSDVPTFSAGVSLYKPGESASAFIERADKALYRAKRLGRNRIELDMTYQQEGNDGIPRRRSTDQ